MAKFIEIKIVDEGKIQRTLDQAEARARDHVKDFLENLGDYVVVQLVANVPFYYGDTLRRVSRTAVVWRPGGAGGGGHWELIAGIKAGFSGAPVYAEFGTGIYAGRGLIGPRTDRAAVDVIATKRPRLQGGQRNAALALQDKSGLRFRHSVKGQRPQRYFYRTWQELNIYASARIGSANPI